MSILIKNCEKLFSEDIILEQFINTCIQKGYIEKKFQSKIQGILNKKDSFPKKKSLKTIKEKEISNKSVQRNLVIKEDCEYDVNFPIIQDYFIINIDGIDYYQNKKSGMIIDTNDFGELGLWNKTEEAIDFISEDHRNFHSIKLL